ncbi:MAG: apolipoprotein N-acyltransferase [Pirellulales bacterium]
MSRAKRKSSRAEAVLTQADQGRGLRGVLSWSFISSLVLLAAFPPLNLYPLAWLAPIGWLHLCKRAQPIGRKGYYQLWLGGCLFWLVSLHSIRLAFWALYAGWVALALYLAIYLPLWVGATRVMVHRWRVPLALAAPIAWLGFEQIRAYMLTGYAANTLAHSQAWQPYLIQIADMFGHGSISFVMVCFAALVTQLCEPLLNRLEGSKSLAVESEQAPSPASSESQASVERLQPIQPNNSTKSNIGLMASRLAIAVALPVLLVGYGAWRIRQADALYVERPMMLSCLLLQENTPTIFEMNPDSDEYMERTQVAWTQYANLCRQAVKESRRIDLVVWPESTFTAFEPYTKLEFEEGAYPDWLIAQLRKYGVDRATFERNLAKQQQYFDLKVKVALLASRGFEITDPLPDSPGPQLLVGCDAAIYGEERLKRHAGALWIGSDGQVNGTYAKMHLVMFGEYIPWRPVLGWLENLFGFAGAEPGEQPKSFLIKNVRISPNICFETMVPRLIQSQVKQLTSDGQAPDLLVNLTNDSWFKGTSMLDHHLASTILCCVENRRPMVIAANTGLTGEIDGCGRLIQCSQRQTVQAIVAQPQADGRWGLVQSLGYPLAWLCLVVTASALLSGWLGRKAQGNYAQ